MKSISFGSFVRLLVAASCIVALSASMVGADMLVAYRDSTRVARYTDAWTYTGDFATFASGVRVLNVVQDKDTGDVYVRTTTDIGSATAGMVVKYDQFGNLVPGWSVSSLSYGKGLAVRDGKVFVGDGTAQTIKWYSASDSSVSGSLSSGADAMGPVAALAFDSQGKLFAAGGTTIKRWDAGLNYLGICVNSSNLTDVKIMPGTDGIRALRWDGYLLGYANDGTWTGPYYYHPPAPWPQAIWISPAGNYYRSATGTSGGIQLLDTATGIWGTLVPENSSFFYPMGIADFQIIPEPGSILVLGSGLFGVLAFVRRRK